MLDPIVSGLNSAQIDVDEESSACRIVVEKDVAEPMSNVVTYAISEARLMDPEMVDPLIDVLDPDGLDMLFTPRHGSLDDSVDASLSFFHAGCKIDISVNENIAVTAQSFSDAESV